MIHGQSRMKSRTKVIVCFLIVSLSGICWAEAYEFHADWRHGEIYIGVVAEVDDARYPLPKAKQVAAAKIEDQISAMFMDSLAHILVDSHDRLSDVVQRDVDTFDRVGAVVQRKRREPMYLSRDLQWLNVRYAFPLTGLGSILASLVVHERPYPMPRRLGFVPTKEFSGLVVYAKGTYDAVGKTGKEAIRPALFPRIFDEQMNLILDRYRCYPDSLRRWGMVSYVDSVDEEGTLDRIGFEPLRTIARAVFGRHSTDIVVSTDIARKLLANEHNIELLREGRILVILDAVTQ